ncbi:MAG TPA: PP2C family protein-serine/threonine phosphatase, partial [Acidothermaceae bacterium]|nr:PP2C family protein-serine/threonine phosphatase [Acidothermaceae bacterium]
MLVGKGAASRSLGRTPRRRSSSGVSVGLRRTWATIRRSKFMGPSVARLWLAGLIVLIGVLSPIAGPEWISPSSMSLPLLGAGLLLPRRSLLMLVAVTAVMVGYDEATLGWVRTRAGGVVVIAVAAVFAYRLANTRERLGLQGLRGEAMLVDLRDRLRAQGELPGLPSGWESEALLRSAGSHSFGGDFLVAARTGDGSTLELALVDVSGKGVDAATRALLLSGALGGLLGAVPPDEFLPAANSYLLRQQWLDGFATAVHLVVDLNTGRFVVESAGHPPPAHFISGSGTWRLIHGDALPLGIEPAAKFVGVHGMLALGDAMMLYTDGLVENAEREISVGIDKLVGEAERLVTQG